MDAVGKAPTHGVPKPKYSAHERNTFAIRENGRENVTHPEFEWSDALEVTVPQVLNQLPISLGHHTTHSQGVVPAIHIESSFQTKLGDSGEQELELHLKNTLRVKTSVPCREVVPISEGPLSEVPRTVLYLTLKPISRTREVCGVTDLLISTR